MDIFAPCRHEEADTRMFDHANHVSLTGNQTLMIIISDTDVVVIDIAVNADLNIYSLWLAF